MNALTTKTIRTTQGEKHLSVVAQDITTLCEPLDVMTVSAFYRSYAPVPGTLIRALKSKGIPVEDLSVSPAIDLRGPCNIWLSQEIKGALLPIGRIGCIEMGPYRRDSGIGKEQEGQIISSIQAFFHMLHIASLSGIKTETIGLPILGAGRQGIDQALVTIPTLNECFRFLKTNDSVRDIRIISNNQAQAFQFARALEDSYSAQQDSIVQSRQAPAAAGRRCAFISYSSHDRIIADNLCAKLEAAGVKVWYAPRNIHSADYASAIVNAITQCTDFIVIVSKSSLQSQHVLNEIDLAFQEMNRSIRLIPLRIDEEEMGPAFRYYLSRQHWMDAHLPPLEKRLEEFVCSFLCS